MSAFDVLSVSALSLSVRRAWIEIETSSMDDLEPSVALRKESVDRNTSIDNLTQGVFVALRKESVDRNSLSSLCVLPGCVALRKESVDRNFSWLDFKY